MSNKSENKKEKKVDAKSNKPGIFRRFLDFFKIFIPGIRVKLGTFIGIIISITILIFSAINLHQRQEY